MLRQNCWGKFVVRYPPSVLQNRYPSSAALREETIARFAARQHCSCAGRSSSAYRPTNCFLRSATVGVDEDEDKHAATYQQIFDASLRLSTHFLVSL